MKKNKEIPIGCTGVIDGYRVTAKEFLIENNCNDCCFSNNAGYHRPCPHKKCDADRREDKKHVYFVIAEKGGGNND